MRSKLLFMLLGVLIGAAAVAAVLGRQRAAPPGVAPAAVELSPYEAALDRAVGPIRLESVPLEKAVDALRDAGGVPIEVEWRRLEEVGVARDAPVRLVVGRGGTLRTALDRLLDDASGTAPGLLAYAPDDRGIVISSADAINSRLTVLVYDVRDLVRSQYVLYEPQPPICDFNVPPGTQPAAPGLFGPPTPPPSREAHRADELISAITDNLDPASWSVSGGPCHAHYFDGRLIVSHNWQTHVLVRKLLQQLRSPETLPEADPADVAFNPVRRWDRSADAWIEPTEIDEAVEAALFETRADVDLRGVPLHHAVRQLGDLYGVEIFVPWGEVVTDGVPPDAPVDLRLRRATLDEALAALPTSVRRAGGGDEFGADLDYSVRGATVVLSSSDHMAKIAPKRVYDVRDLLPPPAPSPAPAGAPGVTADPRAEAADALVRILTDTVDTNSWIDNGGPFASVHEWRGRLIVKQTPRNHRAIESLLDRLRAGERPATAPAPEN